MKLEFSLADDGTFLFGVPSIHRLIPAKYLLTVNTCQQ